MVRSCRKFSQPWRKQIRPIDQKRLVRTEGRQDLSRKPSRCDGVMVVKWVGGIIGGADDAHIEFFQQPMNGKIRLRDLRIGPLPNLVCCGGRQHEVDAKIALQLDVGPVVDRIAKGVGHGLCPCLEFLARSGCPSDQFFGDSIGTHEPPFVVIPA